MRYRVALYSEDEADVEDGPLIVTVEADTADEALDRANEEHSSGDGPWAGGVWPVQTVEFK